MIVEPADGGSWRLVYDRFWMSSNKVPDSIEQFLKLLPDRRFGNSDAIEMIWLPVADIEYLDFASKLSDGDYKGARAAINALLANRPDNDLYRLSALDAAILEQDAAGVWELLSEYRPEWIRSGNAFLAHAPDYYDLWLKAYDAHENGRNLAPKVARFQASKNPDWTDFQSLYESVDAGDIAVPLNRTLLLENRLIPNFLNLQVGSKIYRVRSDFRLLAGDPEGALEEIRGPHFVGTVLMRTGTDLISELIGYVLVSISSESYKLIFLSGLTNSDQLWRLWPELDMAYRETRRAESGSENRRLLMGSLGTSASEYPRALQHQGEVETRRGCAIARMALVHSAAAAKHHLLANGEYPSGEGVYTTLLERPDPDPFADGAPLRIVAGAPGGWALSSLGPDGDDDRASIAYDPTNGTLSDGDLFVTVPREREYKFPSTPSQYPATLEEILARYPDGLPPDPFGNNRTQPYQITSSNPVVVFSAGPDTQVDGWRFDKPSGNRSMGMGMMGLEGAYGTVHALAPPPHPSKERKAFLDIQPAESPYDPTNGIISAGNLYMNPPNPYATGRAGWN